MLFRANERGIPCLSTAFCIAALLATLLPSTLHAQETEATSSESFTVEVVDLESTGPITASEVYKVERLPDDRVVGDFVLGPGKIELEIAPGESKTVLLKVANRIGETKIFDVDVEDMGPSPDPIRSLVLLGDDRGPYTLRDYISIPERQFALDHARRALIPVTISIPPDAEPSGHYGSVLVKTVTQEVATDEDGRPLPSSAIVSRIGTLFFVTIPGDIETGGSLKDFSIQNGKTWFEKGPISFQILYNNTGSRHLNPYGEIRITNMFGEEVGFVELEPWYTLPKSERLREITWNREVLYGKYTATILLNRGYDNIVDEQSITFWVIPWKIVLGGFVALFIVFFLLRAFFRKFEFSVKTK